jgi:hypothetical protein
MKQTSTTLADLLTPLFVANPFWAMRATLVWWLGDKFEDGLPEAEILALRHQLNVLRRKSPGRLAFSSIDRLVFVGMYVGSQRSRGPEDRQT